MRLQQLTLDRDRQGEELERSSLDQRQIASITLNVAYNGVGDTYTSRLDLRSTTT
jgi:hypothetical protein